MDTAKLMGKVRGLNTDIRYGSNSETKQYELTGQGEQLIAPAEGLYTEIVRLGRSFWSNTAVAVASRIAMPTTQVAFAIYNNEPDNGRSYVIDNVWMLGVAEPATLCQVQMVACMGQVREAAPTNELSATVTIKNLNGMNKNDTRARVILTATALPAGTGFAGNWFSIGDMCEMAVASLQGFQISHDTHGRYVVQPGRYFAIHAIANATTVTGQFGISWTERMLLNG